ncbi:MAG: acetylxylan esterase [Pirellulales bacterium]|nr:acetylxylan esterase [Pirellulales bacterium]
MRSLFVFICCCLAVIESHKSTFAADSPPPTATARSAAHSAPPPLTTLDSYFPFAVPPDLPAWEARRKSLRHQLQISLGLWPWPTVRPLPPVTVHGKVERPEYTVERVILQSFPGHFVTGSLYRPRNKSGRLPAVLSPHGHWQNGRFYAAPENEIAAQLKNGAEELENAARHPLQARCVHLARLGCVVFHYDMLGYADSAQIPQEVAHGFRARRKAAEQPDNYAFFSPQAESRLQTITGLQTWNSLRALDWLASLPDVDRQRIGVTGASGGGTQTFLLTALDDRPAAAFPAVMVSTAMQGGCTCENCAYLRVGTGNIELAALTAPRPLGLTAADDWTKEMETKGFPELKQLYGLYEKTDRVELHPFLQFGHNYNSPSRHAMYAFFNKHLKLGAADPIRERDFQPLTIEEMTVWSGTHKRPLPSVEHEVDLLRVWRERDEQLLRPLLDVRDKNAWLRFKQELGGAWRVLLNLQPNESHVKAVIKPTWTEISRTPGVLVTLRGEIESLAGTSVEKTSPDKTRRTSVTRLQPPRVERVVVYATPRAWDAAEHEQRLAELLHANCEVWIPDYAERAAQAAAGETFRQRRVPQDRDYAGYTFGYNPPLLAQRSGELASVITAANQEHAQLPIILWCEPLAAPAGLAARAIAREQLSASVIETGGFRFNALADFDHADFLPGDVKYGDVPVLAALGAPSALWLVEEPAVGDNPANTPPRANEWQITRAAYKAQDRAKFLRIELLPDNAKQAATAVLDWMQSVK